MSRFISRVFYLMLAVVFLLAAAGTSFYVLTGTSIFADEDSSATITAVQADGTDLLNSPVPKNEISELIVTVQDNSVSAADMDSYSVHSFRFNTQTFSSKSSVLKGTAADQGGGCIYTLTFSSVTYQNIDGNMLDFTIIFQNSESKTLERHLVIAVQSSSQNNSASIQSYRFLEDGSTYHSSIYYGTVLEMEVEVKDTGISATYLQTLIDNGDVTISLNNDNFRIRNNAKLSMKVENLSDSDANLSAAYTITCDSVEYMGLNQQLALTVNYGSGTIGTRSLSVRVSNCVTKSSNSYHDDDDDDDDDDDSSSKTYIAPPTPNIIVTSYDYGGGNVPAAGDFTLKVDFKNTSKKLPIDNIVLKVTVPEAFTMTSSSNTFYIEKLGRDSAAERTMGLSVKPSAEPVSQTIKLSFSFEAVIDKTRKQFTSEEEISIPVSQLDRFSLNPLEFPEVIMVGDATNIEAVFVNKGKTPVYNVSAEITGNLSKPGQKQFIGNVESGKEDSADFEVGADMPGELSGEVIVTYEDANMKVGELRMPYQIIAQAMNEPPPDDDAFAMNPEGMEAEPVTWYSELPVWSWAAAGIVVLIVIAFTRKLILARREKKLEELDEDF